MIRELPIRVLSTLRSRWKGFGGVEQATPQSAGKGQNLLRLHEYQHRVLVDIFKTSIAGFFAFALILLSFTLHTLMAEPRGVRWIAYVMGALGVLLLVGLYRTVQEFKTYRTTYEEVTLQLKAKLAQQNPRIAGAQASGKGKGIEQRLLSALNPKEYKGWDAKTCKGCGRAVEMLASVCPSCGQDQEVQLVN
ncbi:MAG TPA: hypothetical protein VL359_07100 [bacterium]|nr:hypothetical protein [bacterium]